MTFPASQLLPIAGLVAFYNEAVDIFLCHQRLEPPKTHSSPGRRPGHQVGTVRNGTLGFRWLGPAPRPLPSNS